MEKKEIKMCNCKEQYYSDEGCCGHKHHHNHNKAHSYGCCYHPHNHHRQAEEDSCGCEKTNFEQHPEHHRYRNEGEHVTDNYEFCLHPSKEKLLKIKLHLEKIIQWIDEQLDVEDKTEK
jgi:hypothetical protein